MPSLEQSRRTVTASLNQAQDEAAAAAAAEPDHDAILASLQDEIDAHNAIKGTLRDSMRKGKLFRHDERSADNNELRFRFKSRSEGPGKKSGRSKHSSRSRRYPDHEDPDKEHRRKKRRTREERGEDYPTPPQDHSPLQPEDEEATPHPFPREPLANPEDHPTTDAFRTSLFDALADDEGAAAYWESVYSQPIHIYPPPQLQNSATGELESMSEAEYVEYVKQKMWEKQHPEVVYERKKRERERKEEEERKTREREEWVRRREQRAWERNQSRRYRVQSEDEEEKYDYVFDSKDWSANHPPGTQKQQREKEEYASAWSAYLAAWDKLKHELLSELQDPSSTSTTRPTKRIPWPVLPGKPPTKPNIEAFMRHAPASEQKSKLQTLKAERVRWHPDKVQQRFGGGVDEGTMKLVTGVFQVVDEMVEVERKKVGGR